MEREAQIEIADKIIFELAEKEVTCKEAMEIIQIVDGKIRTGRSILLEKVNKTSLKETLKEVLDHYSLNGKSPDV